MNGRLLLAALVVILVPAVAVAGRRFASHWWHALCAGIGLVALTLALMPLVGSVVQPSFAGSSGTLPLIAEKLLVASWWALLARTTAQSLKSILRLDRNFHVARLVSDMGEAAIVLATVIVILDVAFGVSVPGLVATSGIIAIVLGLALQNTLGDLFSGIAIGLDRPFRALDTIAVDDGVEGAVIDIDWRSTRIETASGDIATIPNSVLAKSRIVNRNMPSALRTVVIPVRLDPELLPRDGVELLREAATTVASLARDGLPTIACTALAGDGHSYEMTVTCPASRIAAMRSELLQEVARHARYAGVAIAPCGAATGRRPLPCLTLIEEDPVLGRLSAEHRGRLAAAAAVRIGTAGTTLVPEGVAQTPLILVARGVLAARRGIVAIRLGPGERVGATDSGGDACFDAVAALTRFTAYEIAWDIAAPLLAEAAGEASGVAAAAARQGRYATPIATGPASANSAGPADGAVPAAP